MPVSLEEIAWAAGFFDGEGSVGLRNMKNLQRPHAKTLTLQICQCERYPLDEFRRILGLAQKVHGPYYKASTKLPVFKIDVVNKTAVDALHLMLPFLRTRRQQQASDMIAQWLEYQKHKAHSWDHKKGRTR